MLKFRQLIIQAGLLLAMIGTANAADFSSWLNTLQDEARQRGIAPATLSTAFAELDEPVAQVIELDRNQPETVQTLAQYLTARVTPRRVADGRRMLRRYPTWLGRVEQNLQVQRRFIVALWGIETHYGQYSGRMPIIPALATLAFDGRRSSYFRAELFELLELLDNDRIRPDQLYGSWAGAMGQCQFMPSSFRRYAVNADGGRIDIWTSLPDVFASTANYLKQNNWQDDQTWGRQVLLPAGFDLSLTGLDKTLSLPRWQQLGVRRSNGSALPKRPLEASLILPEGPAGPAYLVYANFHALLKWNRSLSFAIAVGTLADRLAD